MLPGNNVVQCGTASNGEIDASCPVFLSSAAVLPGEYEPLNDSILVSSIM